MDYTVHGIPQARILEWVAFPFSRGSSQPRIEPRSPTWILAGGFFNVWVTRETQEYWSGWPIPSPGGPPNPGIELRSPALQADSLPTELSGKLPFKKETFFWWLSNPAFQVPWYWEEVPMRKSIDILIFGKAWYLEKSVASYHSGLELAVHLYSPLFHMNYLKARTMCLVHPCLEHMRASIGWLHIWMVSLHSRESDQLQNSEPRD